MLPICRLYCYAVWVIAMRVASRLLSFARGRQHGSLSVVNFRPRAWRANSAKPVVRFADPAECLGPSSSRIRRGRRLALLSADWLRGVLRKEVVAESLRGILSRWSKWHSKMALTWFLRPDKPKTLGKSQETEELAGTQGDARNAWRPVAFAHHCWLTRSSCASWPDSGFSSCRQCLSAMVGSDVAMALEMALDVRCSVADPSEDPVRKSELRQSLACPAFFGPD